MNIIPKQRNALAVIYFNKVAWQLSPCQGGQKANFEKWGRSVNETKCLVQNVYEGNVVCKVHILEDGAKVNDGWQAEQE